MLLLPRERRGDDDIAPDELGPLLAVLRKAADSSRER
jgi:hypothetical protein